MNLYFKVALQVIGTYGPLCRILAQAENEEMYVFFLEEIKHCGQRGELRVRDLRIFPKEKERQE